MSRIVSQHRFGNNYELAHLWLFLPIVSAHSWYKQYIDRDGCQCEQYHVLFLACLLCISIKHPLFLYCWIAVTAIYRSIWFWLKRNSSFFSTLGARCRKWLTWRLVILLRLTAGHAPPRLICITFRLKEFLFAYCPSKVCPAVLAFDSFIVH